MSEWGDTQHPSHQPDEPRNIGFGTGLVYCRACGCLLRSSKGMGTSPRVVTECVPVRVGPRNAGGPSGVVHGVEGAVVAPVGFAVRTPAS